MKDFKETLNLPRTAFPMKADLARREPAWIEKWRRLGVYSKQTARSSRSSFILHDGPPYANGDIHFGHILNKILKDIIVKFRNMQGRSASFIPGWDCHGLPIEHQVDLELGAEKAKMSKLEIRKRCRAYAQKYVDIQRGQFIRLGILADWDHSYLTMNYDYEATIAREFAGLVRAGYVYKGKKPVLWCSRCHTALAEAEVDYENDKSPSIFVAFPCHDDIASRLPKLKGLRTGVAIWTTTPWTLPGNVAVALHPNLDYVAIQDDSLAGDGRVWIVANALKESFRETMGIASIRILDRFAARSLEGMRLEHPIYPGATSLVVLGEMVTMDRGTGAVHIAPGHGQEDYLLGLKYALPIVAPVDNGGCFTSEVGIPELVGLHVFKANPLILSNLKKGGRLLQSQEIEHAYPHCWRCKEPVIFRATEQWFISMEKNDLRQKALDEIRKVEWIPPWGRERIYSMVANRADWCISRQRSWGVPIMSLTCEGCGQAILEADLIESAAAFFEREGADWWFRTPVEESIPKGFVCPGCGAARFKKDEDILDVWFDSGVSFAAVLEKEKEGSGSSLADLCLEGTDQHRGWFHSSLLTSVGSRGRAPYKAVLTHGFVVDGEGRKYSKSAKNYSPPEKIIADNGTELLRLWTAAEDYRNDIRVSPEILARLVETYRKIRNTFRFLLGNLYDFDPERSLVPLAGLEPLDRWIVSELSVVQKESREAYDRYDFHLIVQRATRYCTVELSAVYLDIIKDRLYVSAAASAGRRAAQTVLFLVCRELAQLVAPLLSFTAEEVWEHLPAFQGKEESIFLTAWAPPLEAYSDPAVRRRYERLLTVKQDVNRALEKARTQGTIPNPLEARVHLQADQNLMEFLKDVGARELSRFFIVSQVSLDGDPIGLSLKGENCPDLQVSVAKASGTKCRRCWLVDESVGRLPEWPVLCARCVGVMGEMGVHEKA